MSVKNHRGEIALSGGRVCGRGAAAGAAAAAASVVVAVPARTDKTIAGARGMPSGWTLGAEN